MKRLRHRPRDWPFALRVIGVGSVVPLLMRLPLDRLERVLEPRRRRAPAAAPETLAPRVEEALSVGHPLVRPGCLSRGVTLYWFLRRAGADVRLAFGMGEVDGRMEGHCWLVRDGEPYLEAHDPRTRYAETYSIPRTPARA